MSIKTALNSAYEWP
ncbi:hypothetical protein D030_3343A, partial [Vibrio parahaemolyticus AQ3810]